MKPLISVIIPIYRVEQYLRQCVDSVRNQTWRELEILLVDDGSPDACPQICDDYAAEDPRIRVIHKENGGLSSARNAGLDAATGDVIAFLDSDDWLDFDAYERMMEQKEKDGAAIVCCDGSHTDGKVRLDRCFQCKPTGTVQPGRAIAKEILLDRIGSQVVKGLYDAACWTDLRFPEKRLYEDMPITYRAFERAGRVAYLNEPFYWYRINPKSISGKPNPIKTYHLFLGFRDHFDYAEQHYPEIADVCRTKAARYAISTYFHACSDAVETLAPYADDVKAFLRANRGKIRYEILPKSRRFSLRLFYFSHPLFRLFARLSYHTGLQRAMHLEAK